MFSESTSTLSPNCQNIDHSTHYRLIVSPRILIKAPDCEHEHLLVVHQELRGDNCMLLAHRP